jgi:putative two-component system response regulator
MDACLVAKLSHALTTALGYKDSYTREHSLRVCESSNKLGVLLDISPADAILLSVSALCHDVGKIGVPDRLLLSPATRFEPDCVITMHDHSKIGFDILSSLDVPCAQDVAEIVLHHHEAFDGSGYPDKLVGSDTPLLSRIICVTDYFDALTSKRPYKPALSVDEAVGIMQDSPKFDPEILEIFLGSL